MAFSLLYRQFISSLRWNALESVGYQFLFLLHQIALFLILGKSKYGMVSTYFALLYLFASIGNMGLEGALTPFFSAASSNRTVWRRFLLPQLMLLPVGYFFIFMGIYYVSSAPVLHSTLWLALLSFFLIVAEGTKKVLRMHAHLALLDKRKVPIELGALTAYIALVWGAHGIYGFELSIGLLAGALAVITTGVNCLLIIMLYDWYKKIPVRDQAVPGYICWKRIAKTRIALSVQTVGNAIFTGNVLVPLVATYGNQWYAGSFALVSTLAYAVSTIVKHVFGVSCQGLFARVRHEDIHSQHLAFTSVAQKLVYVLCGMGLIISVNYHKFALLCGQAISADFLVLFVLLTVSQNLFIAYQAFYVATERAIIMMVWDVCIGIGTYALIIGTSLASQPCLLLYTLLLLRICSCLALGAFSYYVCGLRPCLTMRFDYMAIILGVTGALFILL